MSRRFESHLLWGSHSPLSALSASGLIILASSRLSFAIVAAVALIWVYCLTALIFSGTRRILPSWGKMVILLFLSTFLCGIFTLSLSLLNPLLVLGSAFFLLLIPPCCLGSGYFESLESVRPIDATFRALLEALILSGIIIAFALIREPLGMGTLSVPGGVQGVIELFSISGPDGFVPLRILSVSGGGLLLLGYATALYRFVREKIGANPKEDFSPEGNR